MSAAASGHIAVVGANAVACAAAVDLTLAGHSVMLCTPSSPGPGRLRYGGALGAGVVDVDACESLADAARDAALVVVATFDIRRLSLEAELLAALEPSQTVLFLRGGSLASLRLARAQHGRGPTPVAVELACFPYSSRLIAPGSVHVKSKRLVSAAAWPTNATAEALDRLAGLGLHFRPAVDVLHCALLNPNYVLHPPAVLTNLGSYERRDPVEHEGLTPGSRRLVAALDREHRSIMAAYGYEATTLDALIAELTPIAGAPAGDPWPAEPMLRRFLDEDVLTGLCLLTALAEIAGVDAPVALALVHAFAAALPADMWAARFQPAEVGWEDATVETIRSSLRAEAVLS